MYPIDSYGVLDGTGFIQLVAEIDAEIASGRPVYVHCAYGVGRTAPLIGVWLRHCRGLDFESTMRRIAESRISTRRADWRLRQRSAAVRRAR